MGERDRYEPLPGIAELPRYLWRRAGRAGRVMVVVAALAAVATAVILAPGIDSAKGERAEEQSRAAERLRARRDRDLRALVRPQRTRVAADDPALPAAARLRARAAVVARLRRAIARDAKRRKGEAVEGVRCSPAATGELARPPALDLAQPRARLRCLAVTLSFGPSEASEGGRIGDPYRALVDFERGRITYCRSYGRPGEASLERRIPVTLPRACGG